MTTESKHTPRTGSSPLLGAWGAGAVTILLLVVLAGLTDGRPAVVGAAVGGVLTLLVFGFGLAIVSTVARLVPSASLLVALMTYALQLLVLALVVAAIGRAGIGPDTLRPSWFAAGVIAVTLLWLTGQVLTATRQRIPAYELPAEPGEGHLTRAAAAGAGTDHPGGER
jgi:ATP synthase protein I